jgi:hypothetical protein
MLQATPVGGAGGVPAERGHIAMEYIAFDAHKRYTQVSVETEDGQRRYEGRSTTSGAPCSSS